MKGPLCSARTAKGLPCRRLALHGLEVCSIHAGAPVGRPTKLDGPMADRIEQVLRAGAYMETAATVAGISYGQFKEWMKRGDPAGRERRDAPYRELRVRVEQARAEGEARNVGIIARAANENWQAAAWLLERMYPDRWARPSQREKGPETPAAPTPGDPFAEVDELALRRRG
jgi:hypothetical protein